MQFITIKGDTAVLAVNGNYITTRVKAIKAEFNTARQNGCTKLLVDFQHTTLLDSTGISQLCDFRQLVQPGNFSARNAHGRVLTVQQDSMLDSWLTDRG